MVTFFCLLTLTLLGDAKAFAQEGDEHKVPPVLSEDGPLINVWGTRPEKYSPSRGGQSVIIRPQDETQFDTRVHIRDEPSLTVPDTGRINASGFTLPRVRGQDSRFTEIYLDGLKVQDPYVGFPIIDDLDLRACGELQIYIGNPPPSLPTISPNGAIAYRMFTPIGQKHQLGTIVGRPYGHGVWALSQYKSPAKNEARLYLRQHRTDGQYSYHDDRATPYNPSDDKKSVRTNGDRYGAQALPTFAWRWGRHKISGLGLWNQASTGLPARSSDVLSLAREKGHYRVGKLGYTFEPERTQLLVPQTLRLEAGRYDLRLDTSDPTQAVLGQVQATSRRLDGHTVAGEANWVESQDRGDSGLFLRAEGNESRIRSSKGNANEFSVKRYQNSLYAGLDLHLPFFLNLEGKASITKQRDTITREQNSLTAAAPDPGSDLILQGSSLGLAWRSDSLTFYSQMAQLKRPPTLLEKFGDGGLIRDNPTLSPEITLHKEVGLHWRTLFEGSPQDLLSRPRLRAALFRDDTRDRIILLPSIAQTMRAQNAIKTEVTGAEAAIEITIYGKTTVTGGYARLFPLDESYSKRSRLIPGVAEHTATSSLNHSFSWATVRLSSRFQSQVWRDSENTIAIPGYLVHDLTLDSTWKAMAIGIAVYNLTDRNRLDIYGEGPGASRGQTSYSDYAGMPLPGRNWRVSLTAVL